MLKTFLGENKQLKKEQKRLLKENQNLKKANWNNNLKIAKCMNINKNHIMQLKK